MHTLEEKFSLILKYMGIPAKEINMENSFVKDFEFGEFQFGYLVFYLESYFRIKIKESDFPELNTIGSTKELVTRKVKSRNHLQFSRRSIRPAQTLKAIPWKVLQPVKAPYHIHHAGEDYFFQPNLRWVV